MANPSQDRATVLYGVLWRLGKQTDTATLNALIMKHPVRRLFSEREGYVRELIQANLLYLRDKGLIEVLIDNGKVMAASCVANPISPDYGELSFEMYFAGMRVVEDQAAQDASKHPVAARRGSEHGPPLLLDEHFFGLEKPLVTLGYKDRLAKLPRGTLDDDIIAKARKDHLIVVTDDRELVAKCEASAISFIDFDPTKLARIIDWVLRSKAANAAGVDLLDKYLNEQSADSD